MGNSHQIEQLEARLAKMEDTVGHLLNALEHAASALESDDIPEAAAAIRTATDGVAPGR